MEKTKEFGDFQTPAELAEQMLEILRTKNLSPTKIVEPTCGLGSILLGTEKNYQKAKLLGIEIQKEYADFIEKKVSERTEIVNADFFSSSEEIENFIEKDEYLLFIGNPPWVTNSEISAKNGKNLPKKSNVDKLRGIDAITGKSNFDICEYIIMQIVDKFESRKSVFAFLCKMSVAKKIMCRIWKNKMNYDNAEIYPVDSKKYFNASVASCFFILDCRKKQQNFTYNVYNSIEDKKLIKNSGLFNGIFLEDVSKKSALKIFGKSQFVWHNGVKHDASKVVVLEKTGGQLKNGYGETVDIENDLLFLYLKSSDIANEKNKSSRMILATQKYIGEPTAWIEQKLPKTWNYLQAHKLDFQKRKSVIYKNKPDFSFFSIGDYTYKPYKIAISSLYKNLKFTLIEPDSGKPVLLDDTCNFIAFDDLKTAKFILELLQTEIVKNYLLARISFDSKRPVTTEVLNSIDLEKVAGLMKKQKEFNSVFNISPQHFLFSDYELERA